MRYALLIGKLAGKSLAPIGYILEPAAANAEFKRLTAEPGKLVELHLLISDQGVTKKKRFAAPAEPEPEPKPKQKRAEKGKPQPEPEKTEPASEGPAPAAEGSDPAAPPAEALL